MLKKNNLNVNLIAPTGKGGRILKEDVINYLQITKTPSPPMHAQFQMETKSASVIYLFNQGRKTENNEYKDRECYEWR